MDVTFTDKQVQCSNGPQALRLTSQISRKQKSCKLIGHEYFGGNYTKQDDTFCNFQWKMSDNANPKLHTFVASMDI